VYCGNIKGNTIVQVTNKSVRLIDFTTFILLDEFIASRSITNANSNLDQIVISLTDCGLVYLQVDIEARLLVVITTTALDQDIACLFIQPMQLSLGMYLTVYASNCLCI
jgi:hypothetical protein